MLTYTHHNAPTQHVEANGMRFAYCQFGKKVDVPVVFNHHLTSNLDSLDPAVTDGLAQGRDVILFDNAGVGGSSGEVPCTFDLMARNAVAFIDALELKRVDILVSSIGSMVAQNIVMQRPKLKLPRLMLNGT